MSISGRYMCEIPLIEILLKILWSNTMLLLGILYYTQQTYYISFLI